MTIPTIIGHRDVGLTACPGDYVYSQLPAMRLRVAALLAASRGWAPFSSASNLIAQQYRDVLRREASAAEVASWTTVLESRTRNVGQMVATLLKSQEADTKVGSVIRLYFAFFLRPPDHNGITYWLDQRNRGRTLPSVAESFAASAEFGTLYGSLSDANYIRRVYQNVLGRSPDTAGLQYWLARLTAHVSRGQLMASFSESKEYVAASADRVLLASSFEAMLRRAIDRPALDHYVSLLEQNTSLSSITATLFASAEYQRRS